MNSLSMTTIALKLVKLSHLAHTIDNQLSRPVHIVMNEQQNMDEIKKHKSHLKMRRLETK